MSENNQPPTDAAVREAVERVENEVFNVLHFGRGSTGTLDCDDLGTLLSYARTARSQRDMYLEFGGLSRESIATRLTFAHSLGFGRKGRTAHEILNKLNAAQSPRLTGERLEAVRVAYYMLEGAGLEGGMRLLRAAFPELEG